MNFTAEAQRTQSGEGFIKGNLSEDCIGAAIEVHRTVRQQPLPISYKGVNLDCGYRLDVLVNSELVLEIKAVEKIEPIHEAQLLSYLRLGGYKVGLLLNFNVPLLKEGIRRRVLSFPTQPSLSSAPLR